MVPIMTVTTTRHGKEGCDQRLDIPFPIKIGISTVDLVTMSLTRCLIRKERLDVVPFMFYDGLTILSETCDFRIFTSLENIVKPS